MSNSENSVQRVILWEYTYFEMRRAGTGYGSTFEVKWMEQRLGCKQDSGEFTTALHEIRCQLELEGKCLQSPVQNESGYVILAPQENALQAQRNQRMALSLIRRSVNLLRGTPLGLLTPEEKQRHEAVQERATKRLALMLRTLPKSAQVPDK